MKEQIFEVRQGVSGTRLSVYWIFIRAQGSGGIITYKHCILAFLVESIRVCYTIHCLSFSGVRDQDWGTWLDFFLCIDKH